MYNNTEEFWPSYENLCDVRDGKRVLLLNRIFVLSETVDEIFPLPGDVTMSPLEMIAERGFPLLEPFSRHISYMIDAGIIDKLYRDFFFNVTILENIRDRTRIPDMREVVLTLNHLNGAFSAWIVGLFLSFLAFGAEFAMAWHARHRRAQKMWRVLKFRYRRVIDMKNVKKQ